MTPVHTGPILVRQGQKPDIQEILAIEAAVFQSPWGEEVVRERYDQVNGQVLVATQDSTILGYVIYETYINRFSVLRFATHPHRRREGVMSIIFRRLQYRQHQAKKPYSTLDLPEHLLPAQLMLKKMRFHAVRVDRNHFGQDRDAFHFQYKLDKITDWWTPEPVPSLK